MVPAGVIPAEPKPARLAWKPDEPTPWKIHRAFTFAFVDDAFIGEKASPVLVLKCMYFTRSTK